jgi:hypothetical protein
MINFFKKTNIKGKLNGIHQISVKIVECSKCNGGVVKYEMFAKTDITFDLFDDFIIIQLPNVNSITLKDINEFISLTSDIDLSFQLIYFKNDKTEYSFLEVQFLKKFIQENLPEIKNFYILKSDNGYPSLILLGIILTRYSSDNVILQILNDTFDKIRYLRFKYDGKYLFILRYKV